MKRTFFSHLLIFFILGLGTFLGSIFFYFSTKNTNDMPVIFIHKKNSEYLKHSFWQAKQYNKRIILLGDDTNKDYLEIEHYDMHDYFNEAAYFEKIYKHLAENPYDYELFCFQRWFVLKEFMKRHNINQCFYCDSDVMLYCDINKEFKNFKPNDPVLVIPSHGIVTGHLSYFSRETLEEFCNYLRRYYENKSNLNKWVDWFHSPQKPVGWGVSDMMILTEWVRERSKYGKQIANFLDVKDNTAFELHMQARIEPYRMVNYPVN